MRKENEGKIANFAIIRTALTGKTCSMDRINKGDFFREGWPRDDINGWTLCNRFELD